MNSTIEIIGFVVGILGVIFGIYHKLRADRIVASAKAKGDAPFLKLSEIVLKGGRERDDRWGTEKKKETVITFDEGWIFGPNNSVPKGYLKDWPIKLVCSNVGKAARCVDFKKKPSGFFPETPILDEIAIGEKALCVSFNHEPGKCPRKQVFGFSFETESGRTGYQEYEFDRYEWYLKRIKVK